MTRTLRAAGLPDALAHREPLVAPEHSLVQVRRPARLAAPETAPLVPAEPGPVARQQARAARARVAPTAALPVWQDVEGAADATVVLPA